MLSYKKLFHCLDSGPLSDIMYFVNIFPRLRLILFFVCFLGSISLKAKVLNFYEVQSINFLYRFSFDSSSKKSLSNLGFIVLFITFRTCESAALNMPANLENSAVATGLEKVCFHSNPKEI